VPQLAPTGANLFDDAELLYAGPCALQAGVAAGKIVPQRTAVVSGRVLRLVQDGETACQDCPAGTRPLPGVAVSVHSDEDYGYTESRADGRYNLVVNGGGKLDLTFDHPEYFTVHRAATPAWHEFVFTEDLVMTPHGPTVLVELGDGSGPLTVLGTPSDVGRPVETQDADGPRVPLVVFPADVAATIACAGSPCEELGAFELAMTEYTVGPQGPASMPAELPPFVEYTYCVELAALPYDELGQRSDTPVPLEFSKPLTFYVDNFLEMPIGTIVPVGYYDREHAAWIPSRNGLVVDFMAVDDVTGRALVDFDGQVGPDGQRHADPPDDSPSGACSFLRLTAEECADLDAELLALAQQRGDDVPVSLWRATMDHFTPWDLNWPTDPFAERSAPPSGEPADELPDDRCYTGGSIIDVDGRHLVERVAVPGTPVTLTYASERAGLNRRVEVQLREGDPPPALEEITLIVVVAGRRITTTFQADQAPERYVFAWDGKDWLGRETVGPQVATVRVDYRYAPGSYRPIRATDGVAREVFGTIADPGELSVAVREAAYTTVTGRPFRVTLGGPAPGGGDIGGWSVSDVHTLDPESGAVYRGDGTRQTSGAAAGGAGAAALRDSLAQTILNRDSLGPPSLLEGDAWKILKPITVGPVGELYVVRQTDTYDYSQATGTYPVVNRSLELNTLWPDGTVTRVPLTCEEGADGTCEQLGEYTASAAPECTEQSVVAYCAPQVDPSARESFFQQFGWCVDPPGSWTACPVYIDCAECDAGDDECMQTCGPVCSDVSGRYCQSVAYGFVPMDVPIGCDFAVRGPSTVCREGSFGGASGGITDIELGPDGLVYFGATTYNYPTLAGGVYKVSENGAVERVAGRAPVLSNQDDRDYAHVELWGGWILKDWENAPAQAALLLGFAPIGIAFHAEGHLVFTEGNRVWRVRFDGTLERVAGPAGHEW
jgi:hypothetical protein